MNIDNFFIEENEIEQAKEACNSINDPIIRSRCVANFLAANIAQKYFTDYDVDVDFCIHKIPQTYSTIDIADIYVNNSYIDVRLYFDNETVKIPKYNLDNKIYPVAYLAIKVNADFTSATVMGFATPETILAQECDEEYYYLNEDSLISVYDIETLLNSNFDGEAPDNFEELTHEFLDNSIQDKKAYYKALISSKQLRSYLKNAAKAQTIFENLSITQEEDLDNNNRNEDYLLVTPDELELVDFNDEDSILDDNIELLDEVENNFIQEEVINESEDFESTLDDIEEINIDENNLNEIITESEPQEEYSTSTTPSLSSFEENEEDFDNSLKEVIEMDNSNTDMLDGSIELVDDETYSTKDEEVTDSEVEQASLLEIEEETENIDDKNVTIEIEDKPIEELELDDIDSSKIETEFVNEAEENYSENIEATSNIDSLFNKKDNLNNEEEVEEYSETTLSRKHSKTLPIIGALVISIAIGYFGYTKFTNSTNEVSFDNSTVSTPNNVSIQDEENVLNQENINTEDTKLKEESLMPVETVENIKVTKPTNEGNAISLPAIEQSLGASIDVANLTIKWEVPSAYLTNNTANKYFTKIGKIIQLNLKTEMLLLNKYPITNKIMVELEFNKNNNKFNVKKVTTSSGEQVIDDLIVKTVKGVLDLNLKMNLDVFNNLHGNPVLIIRL